MVKEKFVADVEAALNKHGRCVVAASEGIVGPDGELVAQQLAPDERDAHGNVQLSGTGALGDLLRTWVKAELTAKRVRADTLGYTQRSFLGCVSEVDQFEAREVGEKAAQYAIWHNMDGSVAIRRIGDYAVEYFLTSLESVARESAVMPDSFINEQGNDVTEEFKDYVRPLVGAMPTMERISAPRVAKILDATQGS